MTKKEKESKERSKNTRTLTQLLHRTAPHRTVPLPLLATRIELSDCVEADLARPFSVRALSRYAPGPGVTRLLEEVWRVRLVVILLLVSPC